VRRDYSLRFSDVVEINRVIAEASKVSSDDTKICIGLQAATLCTEFQADQTLGLQVGSPN
jgi:hypothetical protein